MSVVVASKAKDYVVMPKYHFQDTRLSLKAIGLLSIILSLPPEEQDLTLDEVAHIAREERDAFDSILLELQNCGYLQVVENDQSEYGKMYKFSELPPYDAKAKDESATELIPAEKRVVARQDKLKSNEKEERLQKGFEWFWGIYPRRDGKKDAQKAWKAIDPNHELIKKMKQSIKANLSSGKWKLDKPEYIPMPATWLRGERWNDESSNSSSSVQPENDEGFDENGIKWLPWT